MSESEQIPEIKERPTRGQKIAIAAVLGLLCLVLLVFLALAIYLATPFPAQHLSRYVSSYLHQNFKVEKVQKSGGTLILKGVRLENPSGFSRGNLAAADSVTVAPEWGPLLHGRQRYRLVALEGIRINLEKNSSGVWNYSQLQQLLAKQKPSREGTYVKELLVKNGSLKVEGEGVQGVNLKAYNFSTKGSLDSKLSLALEDSARNRYLINGKARGGADPTLDLSLSAPSLSLKHLGSVLKLKNPAAFEAGRGALEATASFRKGELSTSGDFSFSGISVPAPEKEYPIEGTLHFAASYGTESDSARLESCTLSVNDLMTVNASGNIRNLKGNRDFALYLAMDEVDLGTLNVLLSDEKRKHLFVGGRLRCDSLHVLGNRHGLKSMVGTVQLDDGSLTRENRVLAAGLAGTVGFFRKEGDTLAKGKLYVAGRPQEALVESLTLPFGLTVSPKLKVLSAEVPALAARVMGIPLSGKLAFDSGSASPLAASLKVPVVNLATPAVNAQLKRFDLQATSGTGTLSVDASGTGAQDVSGTADLQLSRFSGSRGRTAIAVKKGTVAAKFRKAEGRLQADGNADLAAAMINGKGGDLRSAFRLSDNNLSLDGVHVTVSGAQIAIAHLSGPIPKREPGSRSGYPLNLDFDGGSLKRDQLEIDSISGRLRTVLNDEEGSKWLDGPAEVGCGAVRWQGKKIGAAQLHAAFSRPGGKADLSGHLVGGKLAGNALFDPFAKEASAAFQLAVTGVELPAAAAFFSKDSATRPKAGSLDLRVKGSYSGRQGLTCSYDGRGSGIALTGRGGKSLVSAARLSASGTYAGAKLAIKDAVITPAEGINLRIRGEVDQATSPKRQGSISYVLPDTDLNNLVDPFVNLLPRFIQEANLKGSAALDGRLNFRQGSQFLEGGLALKNAQLEIPAQKFVLADLNGRVPFSLDLVGKAGAPPQEPLGFSRENYPRLLERLRKANGGGQLISIGRIAFGNVETGKVTANLSAANGLTQITSIKSTLFKGTLIGRGYLRMEDKLSYRTDLLVNDLSLKTLCNAFPGIENFISGRMDGVISLSGEGGGVAAMTGFTELWARQGSGEKMVVSKEFLQRLAKQKLSGFFFRSDRPYDRAEIKALLQDGDLSFDTLIIQHTNFFRVRDLNVTIVPGQNRISLDHLLASIKDAAVRGKPATGATGGKEAAPPPAAGEFKWGE
jgi:hypothetical protein